MKRAEAIEWLEYHIAITDYDKDDDLLKALKLAVRELKALDTNAKIKKRTTMDEVGDGTC